MNITSFLKFGNAYNLEASEDGEAIRAAQILRDLLKRENIPSDIFMAKNKQTNRLEKIFLFTDEDTWIDRRYRNAMQTLSSSIDLIKCQNNYKEFLQKALSTACKINITKKLFNELETAWHGGYESLTKRIINDLYKAAQKDNIIISDNGVGPENPEI